MVSKQQAIQQAEKFILENGYTSYSPDRTNISYELLDMYEKGIDTVLKYRYNSLHAKAFYINENDDSWLVGFLNRSVDIEKLDSLQPETDLDGRSVIVNKDGKEIRIAHKSPLFSNWKRIE